MVFIRKGTTEPTDFIDRAVGRRYFAEPAYELSNKPQARLQALFDRYATAEALMHIDVDGEVVVCTPWLLREYGEYRNLEAEMAIGRQAQLTDGELGFVLRVGDEAFMLAVPQNGVEGVPGTYGVEEALDWLESRYPMIYPI
jgi:hypothetical protein